MTADGVPKVTEEEVLICVRKDLGSEDVALDSWKIAPMCEDGSTLGNLGDHYRIVASARVGGGGGGPAKQVSFFVKSLPRNAVQRNVVMGCGLYRKEMLFYRLMGDELSDAVREKRGPGSEFQPFIYPACYLTTDEFLIMHDLGPGWTSPPSDKEMDLDHVRLTIASMARLHAGSLVMEERRGKPLDEVFPDLDFEPFFHGAPDHPLAGWHAASFKLAVEIIPHMDKYNKDPALVKRIQEKMPKLLQGLFPALRKWPGTRNVMVHGDLWVNNILFRYENGKPVELNFVDFQLSRYTAPAHDFIMCIMFCTDQAFQDRHLEELTRLYWDSMAAALRQAGQDPDKVLSWPEWQRTTKEMWKIGLIQMSCELPLALAPRMYIDDVIADPAKFHEFFMTDRSDLCIRIYKEYAFFRRRYTECMERLIDGYILSES